MFHRNSKSFKQTVILGLIRNLALAGFFFSALLSCDKYANRIYNKTLVQVEERSLSVQTFSKQLALRLKYLDPLSAKDSAIIAKFKNEIISSFIVDQLIELWFQENKLQIDPVELQKRITKLVQSYPSDAEFRKVLGEEGLSYKEWEGGIRLTLKREALFEKLRQNIAPASAEELKNYFETNRTQFFQKEMVLAKSILLKDEAQADVIKKLSKKTSFEKLAQEYSIENPKPKEAIYAWVERDSVADLDVLFSNKKDAILGPIAFDEGFRVFTVTSRRPSRQKQLSEVEDRIKKEILALREKARFSAWLDEQIKRYRVLKNTEAINSLKVETRED
jgi:parvulin-like peptidyl-prolyl isomerase